MKFEIVDAIPRPKRQGEAQLWVDMLSQINPGQAARFKRNKTLLASLRTLVWRHRDKYPDYYMYSDDEYIYVAREPVEEE